MWNLLPVALPLSPHLAASRQHFQRCFYLPSHLVHPHPLHADTLRQKCVFLQLWQSSTRFPSPVFNEMVAGREPTAGSTDLGFLFRVLCAQIYRRRWCREGPGAAAVHPKPLTLVLVSMYLGHGLRSTFI